MENNEFDKIFRNKMEEFIPSVSPSRIESTQAYVLKKLLLKSILKWGKISAVALFLLGILYFNWGSIRQSQKTLAIHHKNNNPISNQNQKKYDSNLNNTSNYEVKTFKNNTVSNLKEQTFNSDSKKSKSKKILINFKNKSNEISLMNNKTYDIVTLNSIKDLSFLISLSENNCSMVPNGNFNKEEKKEDIPIPSKMQFNAGIGFEKNQKGNAYCFIADAGRKNLTLNIGLKYNVLKPVIFEDTKVFEKENGHEFNPPEDKEDHDRPEHFHDSNKVKNISQSTYLLSAPVTFQYKVPLYKGLSVITGITSQIDISAKQTVSYDYQINSHQPIKSSSTTSKVSVKSFNSFQLNFGAQFESGKLGIRLFPTYFFKLRVVDYNPVQNKLGMGIQILYRLK